MAQIHELVSPQFRALVAERHQASPHQIVPNMPGFRSTEVADMSTDEHRYVLHHAASVQRGAPEQRMLDLQRVAGGGLFGHSAEHIGDLTHRLNEEGGRFGTEFVVPKVRSQLGSLNQRYGYEREHMEQMRSNARDRGVSVDEHMDQVREAATSYTRAHEQVPVYNEPSLHAARSARNLGLMRFSGVTAHMSNLNQALKGDQFRHLMSQAGSVEYLRRQEESLSL